MKSYAKLIAILLLPLAFVLYYAYSPVQLPPPGWKLSKLSVSPPSPKEEGQAPTASPPAEETCEESLLPRAEDEGGIDTSSQSILFFGDSMVEGLLRRMNGYAFANGHQVTNVVWYGSTTELWAKTDTLRYFMEKAKPTFVMISIGSNEQFVKDFSDTEANIRHILRQLGTTPFVWIGVPAWRADTGINDLTQRIAGRGRYFDSRGLTLQRGSDHRHPTFAAASLWMDSVATWMASPGTAHPIRMEKPADKRRHSFPIYVLQPITK